jgi:hypothetical protein
VALVEKAVALRQEIGQAIPPLPQVPAREPVSKSSVRTTPIICSALGWVCNRLR